MGYVPANVNETASQYGNRVQRPSNLIHAASRVQPVHRYEVYRKYKEPTDDYASSFYYRQRSERFVTGKGRRIDGLG
ncbi:hypothetical protein JCM19037_2948 [Geomicrobium sp. JCM 19037]|uniref:hypothetical protein n=1 Tax=unclassified Geomicrobium TaxID=2628951 RepID=UPI00045F2B00|nr:hypothetical protein [Geomicrobium sp. JCM 19037]GAK04524.1 hypothetical protein JCM19037_2948 [Geomicrobium sp. JCM 19037]